MMMYGQLSLALHALGHMAAADRPLRSDDMAARTAARPPRRSGCATEAAVHAAVDAALAEAEALLAGRLGRVTVADLAAGLAPAPAPAPT